jgi:hypothetical protein
VAKLAELSDNLSEILSILKKCYAFLNNIAVRRNQFFLCPTDPNEKLFYPDTRIFKYEYLPLIGKAYMQQVDICYIQSIHTLETPPRGK